MNAQMYIFLKRIVSSAVMLLCSATLLCLQLGCITFSNYSIPADRIPDSVKGLEKGKRQQLNLALLGQIAPKVHTLDAGDILGVYVKGLVPAGTDQNAPLLQGQPNFSNIYYPPTGQSLTPAVGLPFEINVSGKLQLPLIGEVSLKGLTVEQATELISKKYVDRKVIQQGKEYVYLTLVRSRVTRVMVIRDESLTDSPTFLSKSAPLLTKRGHAQVVDLPAFQNDVLHALTISGGLPGYDSFNEVWILRRNDIHEDVYRQVWNHPTELVKPDEPIKSPKPVESVETFETLEPPKPNKSIRQPQSIKQPKISGPTKSAEPAKRVEPESEPQAGTNRYRLELGGQPVSQSALSLPVQSAAVQPASSVRPASAVQAAVADIAPTNFNFADFESMSLVNECESYAKRIPLWVEPCQSTCISQEDITLREGDIVYLRGRSADFFYTAGLLPGGIVPMPRDHDIDIVEAISLANGSIGGVGGASGIAVIRTGTGPGNILPPTRAIITRKLPNKQQVSIRVDLNLSLRDPKHRPIVQPGDLITLQYKPGEVFGNSILNLVNLNYTIQ